MRIVHFMTRNNRLSNAACRSQNPDLDRGPAVTPTDARIAVMRAGGMSTRAIRRALGWSEAAATAAGLLEPGRLASAPIPAPIPAPAPIPVPAPALTRGSGGPGLAEVLEAVSRASGIDRKTLVAPGQTQPVARARHLVMYLIRELCPQTSLPAIGFLLHRDHTTVLYGCRRAAALLRRDRAFRAAYLQARRALALPGAGPRG